MSSPPAKRQRAENAPITRSDTWFSDGSVVLQANNTQFRVHWGVLALHSSVFSDMQGLPQPPDQPSVQGCPVVELQDDEEDVKFLLQALYTPTFLGQQKMSFPAVAALVRLGRKYEFKDLYDAAVGRLTARFPMTLDEYDALKLSGAERREWPTLEAYRGIHLDVIALASENNLPATLPCAYTEIAKLYKTVIFFDEVERRNGSDSQQRPLAAIYLSYSLGWLRKWDFLGDCARPGACGAVRERLLMVCMDNAVVAALFKAEDIPMLTACCPTCLAHIRDSMNSGRKKTWDELPGLLDLPPWHELKNGDYQA
ncbi:BTB domain-containing protein [Favolaschia claudopus]|uniref:BTB domain-containing protein n=1 Tax=Favolaschia claudopus TaxID=2862362 RepID=A0AAW0AGM9_9AGAR